MIITAGDQPHHSNFTWDSNDDICLKTTSGNVIAGPFQGGFYHAVRGVLSAPIPVSTTYTKSPFIMYFIDAARRLFGAVTVETIPATPRTHAKIRISGIRGDLLSRDLKYYYNTTRVANYMFDKIGHNYVLFPAFFALECLEIMDRIINTSRPYYVNRRTAKQIQEGLLEGTWLSDTITDGYNRRLNLGMLKSFKLQPLDFQMGWLEKFDEICFRYKLNGAILDSVMGSGKTMMGLYVSECSEADVTIIFTPKNALEQVWIKTLEEKLTYLPTIWRSDRAMPYKGERYIVCHYEAMTNIATTIDDLKRKGKKVAIVVDESHNFNEMASARTKLLIELCQRSGSEFIILQSGTPFKAIGAEVVPALHIIDPSFDENLAERFKKLYAASATEALELLKRRLGMITYKVVSSQVGLGKPKIENILVKTPNSTQFTLEAVSAEMAQFVQERVSYYNSRKADDERIFLQILERFELSNIRSGKDRDAYKQYLSDLKIIRRGDLKAAKDEIVRSNSYERNIILPNLRGEEAKLFKELKTIYKYVILKIQGECLGRVLGRRRMECSVEIAKYVDYDKYIQMTEKKSLVYTVYVKALEQAMETLKEKGYTPKAVYADTNAQINSIIKDFERDATINPLAATFKSLSTAVPLTMADVMLMLDVPFRSYILEQTIARIERLGTTTQTYVFIAQLDTDGAPNLSSRTLDILKWSQAQIERITGAPSPFPVEEKSISMESCLLLNMPMPDSSFVELALESAFMAPYE